jgi:hypothetical protein
MIVKTQESTDATLGHGAWLPTARLPAPGPLPGRGAAMGRRMPHRASACGMGTGHCSACSNQHGVAHMHGHVYVTRPTSQTSDVPEAASKINPQSTITITPIYISHHYRGAAGPIPFLYPCRSPHVVVA